MNVIVLYSVLLLLLYNALLFLNKARIFSKSNQIIHYMWKSERLNLYFGRNNSAKFIVKKPLYEEASTKKPEWLLSAGFLTSQLMGGGFSVIWFWLLGQEASKKPHWVFVELIQKM